MYKVVNVVNVVKIQYFTNNNRQTETVELFFESSRQKFSPTVYSYDYSILFIFSLFFVFKIEGARKTINLKQI